VRITRLAILVPAALLLAGCTATVPAVAGPTALSHTIPFSTNRAPDPTPTEDPTTGQVSASEAPLAQLWAISTGDPIPSEQSNPGAWDITDFANAIATRCYPQLTADQAAGLKQLYATFQATIAVSPIVVSDAKAAKNAYFNRASNLCM
jgi:hypothetical protein